ncbi:MAG: hypothetical protein ACLFS9_03370 [Nitriliruptoraceae bacterium]
MNGPTPRHRRAPTRWYLVGGLLLITLIVAGTWWLELLHPQLDPTGNAVEGVPPLALDEEPSCRRFPDGAPAGEGSARWFSDAAIERLRAELPAGGRVSSTQVYRCPSGFDGLEVSYVGEVVGEVLRRDGGAWVQLNDDAYALETGPLVGHRERAGFNTGLPVWLEGDLADRIEQPGRAALRGDVVLVRGTVYRADPHDAGGTTLRATELETLAGPLPLTPPLHTLQLGVALGLSLLALLATLWALRRRRQA